MALESTATGHYDSDFKDETIINIGDRRVCDQYFCKDRATLPSNTIQLLLLILNTKKIIKSGKNEI